MFVYWIFIISRYVTVYSKFNIFAGCCFIAFDVGKIYRIYSIIQPSNFIRNIENYAKY